MNSWLGSQERYHFWFGLSSHTIWVLKDECEWIVALPVVYRFYCNQGIASTVFVHMYQKLT